MVIEPLESIRQFIPVESLITQTLIVHVIRTNKIPFVQGRASWQLTMTTVVIMAIAAWLPCSPLAPALGFTAFSPLYWPILLATLLCYVVLTLLFSQGGDSPHRARAAFGFYSHVMNGRRLIQKWEARSQTAHGHCWCAALFAVTLTAIHKQITKQSTNEHTRDQGRLEHH